MWFQPSLAVNATKRSLKSALPTPLRRTKDPLLSSTVAQHFTTQDGNTFIIRPPPSTLPPTIPIPYHATSSSSSPPAAASPESSDRVNPFFPISSTTPFLLPSTPTSSPPPSSTPRTHLSVEEVVALQELRISNPQFWTRSKLAEKYGTTNSIVGLLGWGETPAGREAEREMKRVTTGERDRIEGAWGWKKSIAREERRKRRTLW